MRMRLLFGLILGVALVSALPGNAQTPLTSIPRTSEGRPDFSGAWLSPWVTTLERLPGATTRDVDAADAKRLGEAYFQILADRGAGVDPEIFAGDVRALVKVGDAYRTSIVSDPPDGKIPYTPEGRKIIDAARGRIFAAADGPEARPHSERCIAGHGRPPMSLTPSVNPRQITQTREHIVIYTEDGSDTRILGFNTPPPLAATRRAEGHSSTRWDKDSLVIETTDLPGSIRGGVQGTFATSPATRVTERLEFVSADEILYSYEIADPALYTRAWRGEYTLVRSPLPAFEYGCHEGNYSMTNMLQSARSADRREAAEGKSRRPRN